MTDYYKSIENVSFKNIVVSMPDQFKGLKPFSDAFYVMNAVWEDWKATNSIADIMWFASVELSDMHHNLGRHIRNEAKLWTYEWTPLMRDGVDYSPCHPDAISSKVIEEFQREVRKQIDSFHTAIKDQKTKLDEAIADLNRKRSALQNACIHTNVSVEFSSSTNNFDASENAYYATGVCQDCGVRLSSNDRDDLYYVLKEMHGQTRRASKVSR
jgi:hypothetical protein